LCKVHIFLFFLFNYKNLIFWALHTFLNSIYFSDETWTTYMMILRLHSSQPE